MVHIHLSLHNLLVSHGEKEDIAPRRGKCKSVSKPRPPVDDTCDVTWGVQVLLLLPALSRRASSPPPGGAAPSPRSASSALAPAASSYLAPDAVAAGGGGDLLFICFT